MPELPEIECIRRSLKVQIQHKTIIHIEIRQPKLRYRIDSSLEQALLDRTIAQIKRRSKYLLMELDNQTTWLIHLGMSGNLIHQPSQEQIHHVSFVVTFADQTKLFYMDTRRFGFTMVYGQQTPSFLERLGVEPFSRQFQLNYLKRKIDQKQQSCKALLMDQTIIAGLGNIYANEILFFSGIHPSRSVSDLNEMDLSQLITNSRHVLKQAIAFNGTSISDYMNSQGKKGRFQKQLSVYARDKLPCRQCAAIIIKIRQHGRSSYFCPNCQAF